MKKSFLIVLLVFSMSIFAGCGGGGGSGSGPNSSGYSVSGTITLGGVGLAGVTVVNGFTTVVTDSNGNYSFSSLSNRDYYITPTLSGYTFNSSSALGYHVWVNNGNVTSVDFAATASTSAVYSISGTISNNGTALSGVTVALSGSGSSTTTTAGDGSYSLSNLQNGSYTVTPTKTGYTFTPTNQTVTVNSANVTSKNFTATATSSVTVSTLAGNTIPGNINDTGGAARFKFPKGITTDGANLYVADNGNFTIRKVVIATGAVTTIAGVGGSSQSIDGTGSSAYFRSPDGIATDGTNLYITDFGKIRKIVIATGTVTTMVINSSIGQVVNPRGISTDGTNLYVADSSTNTIYKISIATGAITAIAGNSSGSGSSDGTGTIAQFNYPVGVASDGANLYVADSNNHTIRKIVIASGVVTTLAGSAQMNGFSDGVGSAAKFSFPSGIITDGTNLYVADSGNNKIRKIVIATGVVSTVAGSSVGSVDGMGTSAQFSSPAGITNIGTKLYIADTSNNEIRVVQ